MKILALDLATNTGVCVGESGADPRAWSVSLGEPPNGRRFSQVIRLMNGLIEKNKPDLVVAEAAIGGPKASAYLIGLVACVEGVCWSHGVEFKTAHLATVRRHFLGKHLSVKHFPHLKPTAAKRAIKQQVMDRCRLLGWQVDDDDCADALAIHDYACATHATGYQSKPLGDLFNA